MRVKLTDLRRELGEPELFVVLVEQIQESRVFQVIIGSSFGGGGHGYSEFYSVCRSLVGKYW